MPRLEKFKAVDWVLVGAVLFSLALFVTLAAWVAISYR